MRRASFMVIALVAAALVACTQGEGDDRVAQLEERVAEQQTTIEELRDSTKPGQVPPDPFTPEGLVAQLHAYFLEDLPGVTPWRDQEVPSELGDDGRRFDTPGAVMVALAGALGSAEGLGTDSWEVAVRVLPRNAGNEADGALLAWGFRDDSVAGNDVRVQMQRDDRGWYIESAETRERCWRGVSDDLCL